MKRRPKACAVVIGWAISIGWAVSASGQPFARSTGAPSTYTAYTATDVKPTPAPPALGAANTVINDPTFGTPILRVTDANTNGGQSFISTDAGSHRAWNANATAIKLTGPRGDGYWLEFNPATFKVGDGSATPKVHSVPSQYAQTWEWSTVNPDIFYVLRGNQIASYNKATGTVTNLGGPSSGEPVAYWAAVVGQDNWVCAAAGSGQQGTWSKLFCIQPQNPATFKFVDIQNKTINGVAQSDPNWPTPSSGTLGIHGLSGGTGDRWVSLTLTNPSWKGNGDAVFNLTTNTWSLVKGSPPTPGGDIYWGGHVSMGNGTFANGAGNQGGQDSRGVLLRNPDNLMNSAQYRFIGQPSPPYNGWCDAEHNSWLNSMSNPNAPIIQSRYGGASGCAFAWTREIIGLATDNSNTVWRFAHSHNSSSCYYGQAFAQVSNDGNWVLFSSLWDGQLGADTAFGCTTRIDTFILKLTADVPAPADPVLAWTQQPSNTVTAMAITPVVAGTLLPAVAHSLTLAVNSGNCTLNGTLTVMSNGSTGAWNFPGVTGATTSAPANCTLKVTDTTNSSVVILVSNSFNVTATTAETITVSINSGNCQLAGPTTVNLQANIWSFPNVSVSTTSPPATCTVRFHDSDAATPDVISNPFVVTGTAPAIPVLMFTQQPSGTVTGVPITPTVAGTLMPPAAHTLTVTVSGSNCSLSGTQTVMSDMTTGAWSFPGLTVNAVGLPATCTLTIRDTSVTGSALDLVSNPFTVNEPTLPTLTLSWIAQPTTTTMGVSFSPVITLMVSPIPALGLPGTPVTLAVTSGSCSLNGTLTQTSEPAVSQSPGVVAFPGLTAGNLGTSCVITASAPLATSITSNPFNVVGGLPPMPLLTRYPVPRKP